MATLPRPIASNVCVAVQRIREDKLNSNPPQVTSYFTYSTSEPSDDQSPRPICTSPTCGFGWRFQFKAFHFQTSSPSPHAQEPVGQMEVTFQPYICSSASYRDVKVNMKVSYAADGAGPTYEKEFADVSFHVESALGTYREPPQYEGKAHIEVTVTFNPLDGLSLPTTPPANAKKALHQSLEGPFFVDTKFYLFSAKVQGEPGIPKAVYAESSLLCDRSTYLRELLSPKTSFAGGTPCDLRQDAPEEIAQLNADAYDYDSDSDLEEDPAPVDKGKGKATAPPTGAAVPESDKVSTFKPINQAEDPPSAAQDGRAFAINDAAYKTWKAFIFYLYTNEIRFNEFKSQRCTGSGESTKPPTNQEFVSCSPKSMYRLADEAGLPELKTLAKEGIRKNLTASNIITELFSTFTSKHPEIIELEVDYLVENFSSHIARDLMHMFQSVVLGERPHCSDVLALTMRRLGRDDTQRAWRALDEDEPVRSPSLVPSPHMSSDQLPHPTGESRASTPESDERAMPPDTKRKKRGGGVGGSGGPTRGTNRKGR